MKKITLLIVIAALATLATGQKTINDANAEKRNVSGFHAIEVSSGIDLYLSQGEESVAVSASETRYRDKIKTEVANGVLKIWYGSSSGIRIEIGERNKKLKAYVAYKSIDRLKASAGSDVVVDGAIKADKFALHVSGGSDFDGKVEANDFTLWGSSGSDIKLIGSAKTASIDVSSGSDVDGLGFAVDMCKVEASSGSDVSITVNKEFDVHASSGSDVRFNGNGLIRNVKNSSGGSVKRLSK